MAGLHRISKSPGKFRRLFEDYPARFMFATDLVITNVSFKNPQWVQDRLKSYLDMLTQETYTTPVMPGETLAGLALPPELVERILCKNFAAFMALKPVDTKITRQVRWSKMGVTPTGRKPGEVLPPPPPKKK